MTPLIVYIMGVSGSGKTTIGEKLSARTGIPFYDADNFHNENNIEKMREGRPLNDEDRADWLARINQFAKDQMKYDGAIIACSALKEKYRNILSQGIVPVFWIFLRGSFELIETRMKARKDHFMPAGLLASQFQTLEIPAQAISVDITNEPDEIVGSIIGQLPFSF
ncbi:MAG TPA: gluconokinase [Chitinophagaceae bacterium]|nr:gluconokinase [Chitinophagaceae bacterium]